MKYYLSTKSIKEAYQSLAKLDVKTPNIIFSLPLLKYAGYNSTTYEPISLIGKKCPLAAYKLGGLFSPFESHPNQYDFIYTFDMANWGHQKPSEKLKDWASGRLKNNVVGGATTWRSIITQSLDLANIKFTHDYVNVIATEHLGKQKIPIGPLALWANRFTEFDSKRSLRDLINLFITEYKISKQELNLLFNYVDTFEPQFESSIHDTSSIRKLIGGPPKINTDEWVGSTIDTLSNNNRYNERDFKPLIPGKMNMNIDTIYDLLKEEKQVILNGPPGTSKSYFANEIAKKYFDKSVTKIQFHPKYSYQDFIGGYVVRGANVIYEPGVLINIIKAIKPNQKHLLIIDEINRANVGQVFGETIQLLDRGSTTQIRIDGELEEFTLPENLYILATMNSADRSLGAVDFAIRRRFSFAYCAPDPILLSEICECNLSFTLTDLLIYINQKLTEVLKNPELAIGHTLLMPTNKFKDGKFRLSQDDFSLLFNHKILPMIEEFCHGNQSQLVAILGDQIPRRLANETLIEELEKRVNA